MKFFLPALLIVNIWSCDQQLTSTFNDYIFTAPYCATVTVGGFVGRAEKCFTVGDFVKGQKEKDGFITIRIAAHSKSNDGPPGPQQYQEFLAVPSGYLKLK